MKVTIKNYVLHSLLAALAITALTLSASDRASQKLIEYVKKDKKERVEKELSAGADANAHDDQNMTPLSWAVFNNNMPLARLLLQHNAQESINTQGIGGRTALYWATGHKNVPLVELLLSHGASFGDYWEPTETFTPQIDELLRIAGAINVSDAERIAIMHTLSDTQRARALRIMQARLNSEAHTPTIEDAQLLAELGSKSAQEYLMQLNNEIAEDLNMPTDITQLFMEYTDPSSQE